MPLDPFSLYKLRLWFPENNSSAVPLNRQQSASFEVLYALGPPRGLCRMRSARTKAVAEHRNETPG
jgi:hypothetical protein